MENLEIPKFIYPITFDAFVDYQEHFEQERDATCPKLHELHKLSKLKKMLALTEQKIENRIKLFRKVSEEILKKKQQQKQILQKKETIKNHPFFAIRRTLNSSFKKTQVVESHPHKNLCPISQKQNDFQSDNRSTENLKALQMKEEKLLNAKNIKMERLRHKSSIFPNQVLIEQNRNKELRKKMKSAGFIRKDKGKAKEIKEHLENERKKSIKRQRQEKFLQEQQQYDELKKNLTKLQIQEREALIEWKKTLAQ